MNRIQIEKLENAKLALQSVAKEYKGFGEAEFLNSLAKDIAEFVELRK